ncbi:MAG TPA: hypothetical protein VK249_20535 [Anaerolineales bacterium]|nr:hypothetical protein [Anaerolineales bacterium]
MPLFEWQISEVVTDFPPEVHINSSPWTTKFGEALGDDTYIFWQVDVSKDGSTCSPESISSKVRRSRNDEVLEQVALSVNRNIIPWLSDWFMIGLVIFICGIYIWFFTAWSKRPIFEAVVFIVLAVVFGCFLTQIWHALLTKVSPLLMCSGLSNRYHGTITFNAELSKIHYETLIVLFAGILLELGAFVVMFRQIRMVGFHNEDTSKSVVG